MIGELKPQRLCNHFLASFDFHVVELFHLATLYTHDMIMMLIGRQLED